MRRFHIIWNHCGAARASERTSECRERANEWSLQKCWFFPVSAKLLTRLMISKWHKRRMKIVACHGAFLWKGNKIKLLILIKKEKYESFIILKKPAISLSNSWFHSRTREFTCALSLYSQMRFKILGVDSSYSRVWARCASTHPILAGSERYWLPWRIATCAKWSQFWI